VKRGTKTRGFFETTLLFASLGCLAAACSGPDAEAIGVDVSFDSGLPRSARDQAVRVEVYVVESCAAISVGEWPDEAVASTHALRDAPDGPLIGTLEPGPYGLYAVAQDAECAVVAAGCSAVVIDPTDQLPLAVTLSAFSGAGCAVDERCTLGTGTCVIPVSNCSPELDETPCVADGDDGVCRAGACCTGCWDGTACRTGDENTHCGVGGSSCQFCECFTDTCTAGQCKPVPAFTDVDLGEQHGCAIAEDGRLWCWGDHNDGQLGFGGTQGPDCNGNCFPTPTVLDFEVGSTPAQWSSVSAGHRITCGVLASDSSLWCWGSNANGRMGAPNSSGSSNVPWLVSAAAHDQVDTEEGTTCAIRTDGTLWCWGHAQHGEVAQGGSAGVTVYEPLEVTAVSGWREVSVGAHHVCAAQRDDRLWCWGQDTDGQLGDGTSGGSEDTPQATGGVASLVVASSDASYSLDISGNAFAWGENVYGQLGMGGDNEADVLVSTPVTGGLAFRQLSGGMHYACGVTTWGALYCWGRNLYAQLGIGATAGEVPEVRAPMRVGEDSSWVSVSLGANNACALRDDGSVWCWGRNQVGQLGLGHKTETSTPTRQCF
jgi:alpha-tubulin suppressor-like RCC1 family protein